ncbi:Molybdopterin molybdenumtransferase [Sporomusa ovata DSM 2662]|uniref:Molybdopterin molybdenumtransferase n=1 Tax=Sporomusa ovata TaxID=2378 RepID=A0A0U1KXB6_9FIRM|nr:gephyrin-like molybdotransferase Glp [Sporomusa ovata]EQB28754.1 molybdopterin molybdenumtransferase [Sporomusa ovata DSM 2662]CQR71905.1 Molybdopterin biosynthesis protein MoeA [Sporomusa ovata]
MSEKLEVAQARLLNLVQCMPKETVGLSESWRRILAETVLSDMDFPPFDRSPLDGYALIAKEVTDALSDNPVILRQVDYVCAGDTPHNNITPGTACRIMTGAPLPLGATGVVRIEDTISDGGMITILDGRGTEKNICFKGEEIVSGEEVIPAGTMINAGVIGMLAVLGKAHICVFRKPQVAIIATGSEIIPADLRLTPGKIRNSNSYMIGAQVMDAGGESVFMSNVQDDADEIAHMLEQASACDIVITTGGASVGDCDLIGEAYKKLGIELLFGRVSIKPGMPVMAGQRNGKLYLGLSGNPASAAISFEQLARPVLMKMCGHKTWWRPRIKAILAIPFNKSTKAKRFVWSRCWQTDNGILVEPLHLQSNGMLKSAMVANSLIVIPENTPPLPRGSKVEAILLVNAYNWV